MKTMVHSEMFLYSHLVAEGKTNCSGDWKDTILIATGKPLCKLYYFYFSNSKFRVLRLLGRLLV